MTALTGEVALTESYQCRYRTNVDIIPMSAITCIHIRTASVLARGRHVREHVHSDTPETETLTQARSAGQQIESKKSTSGTNPLWEQRKPQPSLV